jgi:hypothetical protein
MKKKDYKDPRQHGARNYSHFDSCGREGGWQYANMCDCANKFSFLPEFAPLVHSWDCAQQMSLLNQNGN